LSTLKFIDVTVNVTYVMRKVTLLDLVKNLITQNREANQVKVSFRDAVIVVSQHSILVTRWMLLKPMYGNFVIFLILNQYEENHKIPIHWL